MTITGNLSKINAQRLSEFMSVEPQIRLWDILQTKFKAKALQEKVYIEYDRLLNFCLRSRSPKIYNLNNKLKSFNI